MKYIPKLFISQFQVQITYIKCVVDTCFVSIKGVNLNLNRNRKFTKKKNLFDVFVLYSLVRFQDKEVEACCNVASLCLSTSNKVKAFCQPLSTYYLALRIFLCNTPSVKQQMVAPRLGFLLNISIICSNQRCYEYFKSNLS